MKLLKNVLCLLLVSAMLLCLAACAGNAATPTEPATEPSEEAAGSTENATASTTVGVGDHDQNIVIALDYDLGSFDNCVRSAGEDYPIYFNIYARLYEYDENYNPIPSLAEKKTVISETETEYKIVEGAHFSDGSEITAADVAASIIRARDSHLVGDLYDSIEAVDVVDNYTVKITTSTPYPQLDTALEDPLCCIQSAAFLEKAAADPTLWQNPVCSGRYVVESRVTGDSIVLKPNEYWFDDATKAQNDSLTFKYVPEAATRTIMVQTGEADLAKGLAAADIDTINNDPNTTLYTHDSIRFFYIYMNVNAAPFDNVLFRQAMNYAIDRDSCLLIQEEGYGQVVYDYVAPACVGFIGNPGNYSYDPAKAKELIAQTGLVNPTIELTCDSSFNSMAALIQSNLADVGVTCNIVTIEQMADIIPLINQDKADFGVVAWSNPADDAFWEPCTLSKSGIGANNFAKYSNPELEESFADARAVDENVRIAAYHKWGEILAEDCPWIPLYVNQQKAAANEALKGVEMCVTQPINYYKLTY